MTHAAAPSPLTPAHPTRGSTRYVVGLLLAVLVTYGRLFASDFTWWDDQGTIHHNSFFNPPGVETLRHYWTTMEAGLYVPVTYTVWTAIAKLAYVGVADEFGISLNPALFHGVNVLWHACSTLLVFFVLRRLTGGATAPAFAPAFIGALVFALHPVQVETVAWISGMKDLLCWLGALAVVLLYVRRVQTIQSTGRPLWASWELPAAALVLALAILSKPTAMVTPAALVAIDGLLLRRRWVRPTLELLPLFAISAAGAVVARQAQYVGHEGYAPLYLRPLIIGDALRFYAGKLIWPAQLTIDYGRTPENALADRPLIYLGWLLPAAIAVALLLCRRRLPWLTLGGLILLIGIAPVSGIAQFQMQRVSTTTDHYLYFSMLGVALVAAWAMTRWPGRVARTVAAVAIVALGARAFVQTAAWRDTFTLFEQTIRANPKSSMARNNLVLCYLGKLPRDTVNAERYADEAIVVAPRDVVTLWNYAVAKSHVGKFDVSSWAFEQAWDVIEATDAPPSIRFGVAEDAYTSLVADKRWAEVERWAQRADLAKPDDTYVRYLLESVRAEMAKSGAATRPATLPVTAEPAPGPASAPSR